MSTARHGQLRAPAGPSGRASGRARLAAHLCMKLGRMKPSVPWPAPLLEDPRLPTRLREGRWKGCAAGRGRAEESLASSHQQHAVPSAGQGRGECLPARQLAAWRRRFGDSVFAAGVKSTLPGSSSSVPKIGAFWASDMRVVAWPCARRGPPAATARLARWATAASRRQRTGQRARRRGRGPEALRH
jgi:hypothetical protein